jgi:hypothetical protein
MDRIYRALKARKMAADISGEAGTSAWVENAEQPAKNELIFTGNTQRNEGSFETEKHFLQAVERGDVQSTKRYLETASSAEHGFNINCVDPLGR